MANYFDQFDTPAAAPSQPAPNYFDQFDTPAATAAHAPDAVRADFDKLPWWQKILQAADDDVRLAANGATFGYADKLAGLANGDGTAAERAKSQEAMDRAGSAGTAAELTGAVATPVGLAGKGVSLAGRFGTAAMKGLPGLAARTGLMATEGAGYGAANAAGNDQDLGHGALMGAIFGTGGNLAGEAASGVASKVAGLANKKPVIPTFTDLQNQADAAYQAADNSGVVYTPQAINRLRDAVQQKLYDFGYDPALQPGAAAVVKRLDDLTTAPGGIPQNVTLKGLDTLRKVATNGYIQGNKSNNNAVSMLTKAIDDAVANTQDGDVLMGDAQAGSGALTKARALWAQLAKAGSVNDAVDAADLRAASTGTGGNIDNATRQNLRRVYENGRGFTPDENDALLAAIMGTPVQNTLRTIGRYAPTGVVSGGLGGMVGYKLGQMLMGPEGGTFGAVALPAVGFVAKHASDAMTHNHVNNLLDIIMAGGNKAATQAAPNAAQRAIQANRTNLGRLFTGGAVEASD